MPDSEPPSLHLTAADSEELFVLRRADLEFVREGFWQEYTAKLRRNRMLLCMFTLFVCTVIAGVGRLGGWPLYAQLLAFLPGLIAGLTAVLTPYVQARRLHKKFEFLCPSCRQPLLETALPSGLRRTARAIQTGECQHCHRVVLAP